MKCRSFTKTMRKKQRAKNRSSLEVDFVQLHRHRLQRGQTNEEAPPPTEELYKRIIYQAEVAENAANKMKAVSEAALQLFAEQEKFFKGVKEEMSEELALLELPK